MRLRRCPPALEGLRSFLCGSLVAAGQGSHQNRAEPQTGPGTRQPAWRPCSQRPVLVTEGLPALLTSWRGTARAAGESSPCPVTRTAGQDGLPGRTGTPSVLREGRADVRRGPVPPDAPALMPTGSCRASARTVARQS